MDGLQLSDLSGMISRLSENPAAMNALSSMLGNLGQSPPKSAPKNENPDILSVLGSLSSLMNGSPPKPEYSARSEPLPPPQKERDGEDRFQSDRPHSDRLSSIFGTREEIKNRILLLNALRPYLSETRRERLELVIKLLKLTELGELGALLNRP